MEKAPQAIDNMIGFRERTPDIQLQRWAQNLQIDSKILTSQAKEEPYENIEDELEKIIIQDIKAQMKHESMMKAV